MSKRKKQTALLKALVLHGNMDDRLQLQERINKAERDELCAWRAFWLVSLVGVFSCCGLCYSAVLIPEFFQNSSHIIVKIFCGLGLASLTSAVVFLFFWLWCRGVLNRLHEDCRRFVMAMLEPGGRSAQPKFPADAGEAPESGAKVVNVYPRAANLIALPTHQTYSELFSLRRSS